MPAHGSLAHYGPSTGLPTQLWPPALTRTSPSCSTAGRRCWGLRCHLSPGLHKLSEGSSWQGARPASVALMWASTGQVPGPAQGIWLEAVGARLNEAGAGGVGSSPCPCRGCSSLHSRALHPRGSGTEVSPGRGTATGLVLLGMGGTGRLSTHLPGQHPPHGSTRFPGTKHWEGMRGQSGWSIPQAAPRPCRRCRHRRGYGAAALPLTGEATGAIVLFKKPSAQVVGLHKGACSGTAAAPLRYQQQSGGRSWLRPETAHPLRVPQPSHRRQPGPPRRAPDYRSRHPPGTPGACSLSGIVVLPSLSVRPPTATLLPPGWKDPAGSAAGSPPDWQQLTISSPSLAGSTNCTHLGALRRRKETPPWPWRGARVGPRHHPQLHPHPSHSSRLVPASRCPPHRQGMGKDLPLAALSSKRHHQGDLPGDEFHRGSHAGVPHTAGGRTGQGKRRQRPDQPCLGAARTPGPPAPYHSLLPGSSSTHWCLGGTTATNATQLPARRGRGLQVTPLTHCRQAVRVVLQHTNRLRSSPGLSPWQCSTRDMGMFDPAVE